MWPWGKGAPAAAARGVLSSHQPRCLPAFKGPAQMMEAVRLTDILGMEVQSDGTPRQYIRSLWRIAECLSIWGARKYGKENEVNCTRGSPPHALPVLTVKRAHNGIWRHTAPVGRSPSGRSSWLLTKACSIGLARTATGTLWRTAASEHTHNPGKQPRHGASEHTHNPGKQPRHGGRRTSSPS